MSNFNFNLEYDDRSKVLMITEADGSGVGFGKCEPGDILDHLKDYMFPENVSDKND